MRRARVSCVVCDTPRPANQVVEYGICLTCKQALIAENEQHKARGDHRRNPCHQESAQVA